MLLKKKKRTSWGRKCVFKTACIQWKDATSVMAATPLPVILCVCQTDGEILERQPGGNVSTSHKWPAEFPCCMFQNGLLQLEHGCLTPGLKQTFRRQNNKWRQRCTPSLAVHVKCCTFVSQLIGCFSHGETILQVFGQIIGCFAALTSKNEIYQTPFANHK